MNRLVLTLGGSALALVAASAHAQLATFDALPEGPTGLTFVDGGITFFDGDNRLAPEPPDGFIVENASASSYGPLFSSPNVLTMTAWDPGPQAIYARVGEFKATLGGMARTLASADVFYSNSHFGNSIVFELLRNGGVVASQSVAIGMSGFTSHHFEILGVEFDALRLAGAGPLHSGCFFGSVDNVRIDIPAPGAAWVFAGLSLTRRRRR